MSLLLFFAFNITPYLLTRPILSLIGFDKKKFERKIVNIFLPISFNICFGCSKEPSHLDGPFECVLVDK